MRGSPGVRVFVSFNRPWGLWDVVASDHWGARIFLETPDEAKARAVAVTIREQNCTTLGDVRAVWEKVK